MGKQFFKNHEIYNISLPIDTNETISNLELKYEGKNLLKEIALFAGCMSSPPLMAFVLAFLRALIPYMVRIYEKGNAFD